MTNDDLDIKKIQPKDPKRVSKTRTHFSPEGLPKDNSKKKKSGLLTSKQNKNQTDEQQQQNPPSSQEVIRSSSRSSQRGRSPTKSRAGKAARTGSSSTRSVSRTLPHLDGPPSGEAEKRSQAALEVTAAQQGSRKRQQNSLDNNVKKAKTQNDDVEQPQLIQDPSDEAVAINTSGAAKPQKQQLVRASSRLHTVSTAAVATNGSGLTTSQLPPNGPARTNGPLDGQASDQSSPATQLRVSSRLKGISLAAAQPTTSKEPTRRRRHSSSPFPTNEAEEFSRRSPSVDTSLMQLRSRKVAVSAAQKLDAPLDGQASDQSSSATQLRVSPRLKGISLAATPVTPKEPTRRRRHSSSPFPTNETEEYSRRSPSVDTSLMRLRSRKAQPVTVGSFLDAVQAKKEKDEIEKSQMKHVKIGATTLYQKIKREKILEERAAKKVEPKPKSRKRDGAKNATTTIRKNQVPKKRKNKLSAPQIQQLAEARNDRRKNARQARNQAQRQQQRADAQPQNDTQAVQEAAEESATEPQALTRSARSAMNAAVVAQHTDNDNDQSMDQPIEDTIMDSASDDATPAVSTRSHTHRTSSNARSNSKTRKTLAAVIQKRNRRVEPSTAALTRSTRSANAQQRAQPPSPLTRERRLRATQTVVSAVHNARAASHEEREVYIDCMKETMAKFNEKDGKVKPVANTIFPEAFNEVNFAEGAIWDGTDKHKQKLYNQAKIEGFCADYSRPDIGKFEPLLKKELRRKRISLTPKAAIRWYWRCVSSRPSVTFNQTHPTVACAKLWQRKKNDVWYEKEVKMVARFIQVGALCERCVNPFKLSPTDLENNTSCNCPLPIAPKWKKITVSAQQLEESGETRDKLKRKLWNKQFEEYLKKTEDDMRNRMIKELGGENVFNEHYPMHRIPLREREDLFGRTVYKKAKQLNKLRRDKNQCPVFFHSWTQASESSDINMPQKWIGDSESKYSPGCQRDLDSCRREKKEACKNDCKGSHKCCVYPTANVELDKNGLLIFKGGLRPCGNDDPAKSIPRTDVERECFMKLCDETCGCSDKCPLKALLKGPQKMKIVFRTHDRGWSIRTAEAIVRGEYIFSFDGLVMQRKEINAQSPRQNEDMFFDITPERGWTKANRENENNKIITTCNFANIFKYINHSCSPNAMICRLYTRKYGDKTHATALFARQLINAYDELTYDYYNGFDIFPFACRCGSYACRGAI